MPGIKPKNNEFASTDTVHVKIILVNYVIIRVQQSSSHQIDSTGLVVLEINQIEADYNEKSKTIFTLNSEWLIFLRRGGFCTSN